MTRVSKKEYKRRREIWLSDLETTKAGQANGVLHNRRTEKGRTKSRFCCLGRACLVFKTELYLKVSTLESRRDDSTEVYYNDLDLYLPEEVADYLGMHDSMGNFLGPESADMNRELTAFFVKEGFNSRSGSYHSAVAATSLAQLNDAGVPFKQIAAIIRRFPDWVFQEGTY